MDESTLEKVEFEEGAACCIGTRLFEHETVWGTPDGSGPDPPDPHMEICPATGQRCKFVDSHGPDRPCNVLCMADEEI